MMTRKHFESLADMIRDHNERSLLADEFYPTHILRMADWCEAENPNFDRDKFLQRIDGSKVVWGRK